MTWALINEQQDIEVFDSLPRTWKNYSNFFALESNVGFLNSLGWYTLIDDTIPITNDLEEYHGPPEYTFDEANGVIRKNCPVIRYENPPTAEQIHAANRERFLTELRMTRTELLKDCDWTQTVDLQAIKDEEWKQSWVVYRQVLRDLPNIYSDIEYDHVIRLDQVNWPPIPEA
jgi:hypothetical protein